MYPALVVLWLGAPAAPAEPPAQVVRWAEQRGYRAVPVPATAEATYAEDVPQELERLLEEARSVAPGAAPLARIDQLLELHPELPQASWWLAERYALERQQALQAPTPMATEQLEQLRAALEGPRAETAGGVAAAGSAAAAGRAETAVSAETSATEPSPAPLVLEVRGLRPQDELVLDGEPARSGTAVAPGRHHAQLFRAQRRIWAGWLELGSAQLELPEVGAPCTDLDLLGTRYAAPAPRAATGVQCPLWAAAHDRGGRLEIALCRSDHCEPWQAASAPPSPGTAAPANGVEPPQRLPAWLTWGALGLGAAASTALVLWQAGVFDRPAHATQFVFTGPSAAAVRF